MEQSLTDYFELKDTAEAEPQEEDIQADEQAEDAVPSDGQEENAEQENNAESMPDSDNLISYEPPALEAENADGAGLPEEPPEAAPLDSMETA